MPRTAVWVLPAAALTWLKAQGIVHSTATVARLEIRPGLPTVIYTDRGNRTPPGVVRDARTIRDWLAAAGLINEHVRGLYIDTPTEVVDQAALTARAQLTDAIQVQAVLDFLAQTPAVR